MKQPETPTPVDFSNGEYKFAYKGDVLKKAIYEKTQRQLRAIASLRTEIREAIGENQEDFVGLVIALHAADANERVLWIKAMSQKVLRLTDEQEEIARIGKGMADSIVYLLSPAEMKKFGL